MINEIEIIKGHNYNDYFWIRPVEFVKGNTDESLKVIELRDEISIQEDNVDAFLAYFFFKYYDNSLSYNSIEPDHERNGGKFEWYLTYNFFTYETINKMCDEILEVADLLENDYKNPVLEPIKKSFSFCYECDLNCDIINGGNCLFDVDKNIGIVIRFYRQFVKLIREIMSKNPQTSIISIMGP